MWPMTTPARSRGSHDRLEPADDALSDVEQDGRVRPTRRGSRRPATPGAGTAELQPSTVRRRRPAASAVTATWYWRPRTAADRQTTRKAVGHVTSAAWWDMRAYDAGMLTADPLVESLGRIPFFAGLDEAALERVAAGTRTRRFRRGEIIFHAGDPGDALFIIVSGEVKIALPSERATRRSWPPSGRATCSASWPCSTARRVPRPRRR